MTALSIGVIDTPVIAASRPGSSKFRTPTALKARGLYCGSAPLADNNPLTNWSTNWLTMVKPQIDSCVAVGANSLKWSAIPPEVFSGAITLNAWKTAQAQWFDYVAGLGGLSVYMTLNYSSMFTSASHADKAVLVSMVDWMHTNYHGMITGLDIYNEGSDNANALAHLKVMRPALQAVTDIPLTMSINAGNINQAFADDHGAATVAPYCDFMDFHPYWSSGDLTPQNVLDWWRTQTYYKPFVIGECGQAYNLTNPTTLQRWTALGLLAALPDCFGAYGYRVWDREAPPSNFGIYDSSGANQHADIAAQFATWPAHP